MGFIYNRGTPPIARDDAGNPGERCLCVCVCVCVCVGVYGCVCMSVHAHPPTPTHTQTHTAHTHSTHTHTHSRPANYAALGKAVGLSALMAGLGFMLANFLMASVPLPRWLAGK